MEIPVIAMFARFDMSGFAEVWRALSSSRGFLVAVIVVYITPIVVTRCVSHFVGPKSNWVRMSLLSHIILTVLAIASIANLPVSAGVPPGGLWAFTFCILFIPAWSVLTAVLRGIAHLVRARRSGAEQTG